MADYLVSEELLTNIADAIREKTGETGPITTDNFSTTIENIEVGEPYITEDGTLTVGQEGVTFPPKTLFKDGLQIINGVNGEDLTETEARQDDVVTMLERIAMRKISEHNGEGEFVWKKMTAEGGEFIDFVVNSDETAYPDGGNLDGYWYERVSEGISVTIDTIDRKEDLNLVSMIQDIKDDSFPPYNFSNGTVVVYNNEIHIMSGSGMSTRHFKWNGYAWTELGTLPFTASASSTVVYNNEIHLLGSSSENQYKKHYKWDGSTWTSASTLPYNFYAGGAVVYNNEIHILGGNGDNRMHYKWDGSTWTNVSSIPIEFFEGSAVVYNNEIHILGNGSYFTSERTRHYKWNGSAWSSVSTIPIQFSQQKSALIYNNEIHIFSGTNRYKWNGSAWTQLDVLPYSFYSGVTILYKDIIHLLGGSSEYAQYHYMLDVPVYREV